MKTTTDDHSEVNREAARKLRETPAPTITTTKCPNVGCGVFLLSDGFCPRCQPRQLQPGPLPDGAA